MKGMYGLDVLTKLRELDPAVRVIVVSADVQTRRSELVEAAGAVGFINKPVDPQRSCWTLVRGALARDGMMKLTAVQEDALIELLNIGFGRAAASLSQLTGHRVLLEVPHVTIHPIDELSASFGARSSRPMWRACTRSSADRSPATRC